MKTPVESVRRQFEEDLAALDSLLRRPDPLPPSHVRITASAVLRKWFLDGHLNRLGKSLGVKFSFPVLDTSSIVDAIAGDRSIRFFLAGGVLMNGLPIRGYYVSDVPYDGQVRLPINSMKMIDVRSSHFLKSHRIYHEGCWFDTADIMRFAANKAGGVHLDFRREQDWQHRIEAASEYFVLGNPDKLQDRKVQIIEPYSPQNQILLLLPKEVGHLWTCLDVELLAAAQSLINIRCNDEPLVIWDASVKDEI